MCAKGKRIGECLKEGHKQLKQEGVVEGVLTLRAQQAKGGQALKATVSILNSQGRTLCSAQAAIKGHPAEVQNDLYKFIDRYFKLCGTEAPGGGSTLRFRIRPRSFMTLRG